jgi:hypothetical protein
VGTAQALDLIDAGLCPHVPKLDHSVAADAAELCILDWVESNLLDPRKMSLQFGGETDIRFLGIPYNMLVSQVANEGGLRVIPNSPSHQ